MQPKTIWHFYSYIFSKQLKNFFLKLSKLRGGKAHGTFESRAHSRETQEGDLTVMTTHKPDMAEKVKMLKPFALESF